MIQYKRNYQKELEAVISRTGPEDPPPHLFLHSCCAPCSSYVLEYLSEFFLITDYFYNPNITEEEEYRKRAAELRRLSEEQPHRYPVTFLEGPCDSERFFEAVKGFEDCPEGGERCRKCFELRLFHSAEMAAEGFTDPVSGETRPFDYLTTTLTISPLKNADVLNEIGEKAAAKFGLTWLPSDFKKRGGYQRSIELSKEYGLYRQNFCGCVFSKRGV